MTSDRPMRWKPRGWRGWTWLAITLLTIANGFRLRARARALRSMSDAGSPGDPGDEATEATTEPGGDRDYAFVTAAGLHIDDGTRSVASRYACRQKLEVLDLVPADLRVEQLLDLLRSVDPGTYRSTPLAAGRGAGQATLVHKRVLERAGIKEIDQLDPASYIRVIAELKRCAARTSDFAIAEGLHSVSEGISERRPHLAALYDKAMPAMVTFQGVRIVLLAAGLFVVPPWGAAALAAYCAQPYLVLKGGVLRPRDLTPVGMLVRPLREAWNVVGSIAVRADTKTEGPLSSPFEDQVTEYRKLLSGGVDRFFEPRRETCPLCSSTSLLVRVRVPDLVQFKPGEFELDECAACGHIFQNPRLSLEGLDFYYKDFYDGAGSELISFISSTSRTTYLDRANIVAAHARPKRWLDVGAGHGHFCLIASEVLPETHFEGTDQGDGIVTAERRGWIDRAHVGQFPEIANDLRGSFDVVSMHHYIEHTRDPAQHLAAAAKVLVSGGVLSIEVPDPECAFGRMFGWMWLPWFQPQHQHLLSKSNLAKLLVTQGFTVLCEESGPAHQPFDLVWALLLVLNRISGPPKTPWLPLRSRGARFRRTLCLVIVAPLFLPALILDQLLGLAIRRRPRGPNTYRMLARKS